VVLRGLGSNFVIFGGRLIEFFLFSLSLSKAEILLWAFLWEKTRNLRTFIPDFYSRNPGVSGKKCGDSGLSSGVCLGLFDCASALFLSLL
jgi:hypothetical protein